MIYIITDRCGDGTAKDSDKKGRLPTVWHTSNKRLIGRFYRRENPRKSRRNERRGFSADVYIHIIIIMFSVSTANKVIRSSGNTRYYYYY